jgi:hypothetical protein
MQAALLRLLLSVPCIKAADTIFQQDVLTFLVSTRTRLKASHAVIGERDILRLQLSAVLSF